MPHPFDRYHALITTEELDPAHVQAMFRLRKRLFVDHCGWMLATIGDLDVSMGEYRNREQHRPDHGHGAAAIQDADVEDRKAVPEVGGVQGQGPQAVT